MAWNWTGILVIIGGVIFATGNGLMVLVLHRIEGRVRFKVDGLRGSAPLLYEYKPFGRT